MMAPFGSNLWVRREVFDNGRRFDERLGPRPTKRMMGGETSFLFALLKDGYEIVYSPTVIVGHRIQPEALRLNQIFRRAYRLGRGGAYQYPLVQHRYHYPLLQHTLLKHHPAAWYLYRCGAITWNTFIVLFSAFFCLLGKHPGNCVLRIRDLGLQIEAIRWAKQHREEGRKRY